MSGWRSRYRSGRGGGGDKAGGFHSHPVAAIRRAYAEAVKSPDPTTAPSKAKTWAEMTETEREEMRRLYEKKP